MKCIAIIPARGGSQRIPRKNIKPFYGVPIIAHSIRCAQRSQLFADIIVSTDDDEIEAVARSYGAAIHRRPVCDGRMGTQEVAAWVLTDVEPLKAIDMGYDRACVIYATAPLLLPSDLSESLNMLRPSVPYVYSCDEKGNDAGALYWGHAFNFVAGTVLTGARYILPNERVCDINTPEDWAEAEAKYDAMRERAHNEFLNRRGGM